MFSIKDREVPIVPFLCDSGLMYGNPMCRKLPKSRMGYYVENSRRQYHSQQSHYIQTAERTFLKPFIQKWRLRGGVFITYSCKSATCNFVLNSIKINNYKFHRRIFNTNESLYGDANILRS